MAMAELTGSEKKALLDAAKIIHTYKFMQSSGYERFGVYF
jgi:hypothetical protein